jgi:hypothetical protein
MTIRGPTPTPCRGGSYWPGTEARHYAPTGPEASGIGDRFGGVRPGQVKGLRDSGWPPIPGTAWIRIEEA